MYGCSFKEFLWHDKIFSTVLAEKKGARVPYCGTRVKGGKSCQVFLCIVYFAYVSKLSSASNRSFMGVYSRHLLMQIEVFTLSNITFSAHSRTPVQDPRKAGSDQPPFIRKRQYRPSHSRSGYLCWRTPSSTSTSAGTDHLLVAW